MRHAVVFFTLLAGGSLLAQEPVLAPQVTVDGPLVDATTLADPGSAVFFGLIWEDLPGTVRISTHAEIVPVAAGAAAVELTEVEPLRSAWAVVDLTTGVYALTPSDVEMTFEVPPPDRAPAVGLDVQSVYSLLEDRRETIELLVVRPGVGAWTHTASDGGLVDEDGAPDGRLKVNLAAATPVGETPDIFRKLQKGDVVIGFDPYRGEVYALEIGL